MLVQLEKEGGMQLMVEAFMQEMGMDGGMQEMVEDFMQEMDSTLSPFGWSFQNSMGRIH
jgi:hypothetical protein